MNSSGETNFSLRLFLERAYDQQVWAGVLERLFGSAFDFLLLPQ